MNVLQQDINLHWTEGSENYNEIIRKELESFRPKEWLSLILSKVPENKKLKILDTGCGPGFFSIILSRAGHEVVGIDSAEGMLEKARSNGLEFAKDVNFMTMDAHSLLFEDQSFDLIVSRNVTHTLIDHRRVYCEWLRVLKPGGCLLIFDANWHLVHWQGTVREEAIRRERECIEVYGATFGDTIEEGVEERTHQHVLQDKVRPDWDIGLLEGIGFADIAYERDITESLWDDKEKLIFGATPMFMVSAYKK